MRGALRVRRPHHRAHGLVAREWGPSAGGLFLAFPAILPASLTLVARHDSRGDAADDARGAVLGAAALIVFAAVVLMLVQQPAWVALGAASGVARERGRAMDGAGDARAPTLGDHRRACSSRSGQPGCEHAPPPRRRSRET
ncbi:MAG: DUF3147 family protein [Deltaproteobacteria bacterium]|nr:MAG: DUF3147 family protein [Deltaproteobacteria bacterium]